MKSHIVTQQHYAFNEFFYAFVSWLQFQAFTRTNNDATAHVNSKKALTTKAEPALQLSSSQHETSHVIEPPTPSLQIGLSVLLHAILGEQPLWKDFTLPAMK